MTTEGAKDLINSPDFSDKKAEQIRSECRIFAEIIFEQWLYEKRRDRMKKQDLSELQYRPDVNKRTNE